MNLNWHYASWNELNRDDLYDLLKLRINVFVVEQNCPYPECDDKDQKSGHLWARNEQGVMVACLRIVQPGVSYAQVSIGRVATAAEVRGAGCGRELMKRGIEKIQDLYGQVEIKISAQLYLEKFYSDFGFRSVGEPYPEDDIPHIAMIRPATAYL
jgi:ElaA protein